MKLLACSFRRFCLIFEVLQNLYLIMFWIWVVLRQETARLYIFGFITYIVQVTTSQALVKFSNIYRRLMKCQLALLAFDFEILLP